MPGDGVIREYTPAMFAACLDLFIEAFNGAPWNDSWTEETAGACLREIVENTRFFGFTLWEGGALVGAAFCHAWTYWRGGQAYVDELFVAPGCQRKGYGGLLMEAVEAYARAQGLVSVTLLTNREYPSFAFFEGQGYRQSGYMVYMHKRMK
ncbi:MAG: GNAT family N-acetyltransferase [Oscillospiraceae bacterium]|jgi:GNAT superfamily N-acetyltransferase|nr:GNAT family N-acetyltransferase [Oscillospiraceae bacterium]